MTKPLCCAKVKKKRQKQKNACKLDILNCCMRLDKSKCLCFKNETVN